MLGFNFISSSLLIYLLPCINTSRRKKNTGIGIKLNFNSYISQTKHGNNNKNKEIESSRLSVLRNLCHATQVVNQNFNIAYSR